MKSIYTLKDQFMIGLKIQKTFIRKRIFIKSHRFSRRTIKENKYRVQKMIKNGLVSEVKDLIKFVSWR